MAAFAPFVTPMPCTLSALSTLPARMILARFTRTGNEARRLERNEVHRVALDLAQVAKAHLDGRLDRDRDEAALGHAALQRHLAAFEADLVVAAGARFLALVAAARGLAEARADAATDAAPGLLGARGGLDRVEFHGFSLDFHEVAHLVDHAADRGRIVELDGVPDATQAEAAHRRLVAR